MDVITEKYHEKRLDKYKINIKTRYQDDGKVLEKNTDNSRDDDITEGIRLSKTYFINNNPVLVNRGFNPRITYTFLASDKLNEEVSCPNCGYTGKRDEFLSGCKFCGTYYNIDYTDKELSTKYHYDRVLKSKVYLVITFLLDLIICISISLVFFKTTGRTFTTFDILKASGFGLLAALLLYFVFYTLDAIIVTIPVKIIKDAQNRKQEQFWNKMKTMNVTKKNVFNNLNMELQKFYYDDKVEANQNVIDYDILEYNKYEYFIDNKKRLNIVIEAEVRLVTYQNGKIKSKVTNKKYKLRRNEKYKQNNSDKEIIICHNCGASIDVTKDGCEFCGTKFNKSQEWYLC